AVGGWGRPGGGGSGTGAGFHGDHPGETSGEVGERELRGSGSPPSSTLTTLGPPSLRSSAPGSAGMGAAAALGVTGSTTTGQCSGTSRATSPGRPPLSSKAPTKSLGRPPLSPRVSPSPPPPTGLPRRDHPRSPEKGSRPSDAAGATTSPRRPSPPLSLTSTAPWRRKSPSSSARLSPRKLPLSPSQGGSGAGVATESLLPGVAAVAEQ
ncbi:unnamed protein product, partial [Discosporangium mesarthrocarpum]